MSTNSDKLKYLSEHVKSGDAYIEHAEKVSKTIPDKELHKKISEVREKITEVQKYTKKVLEQ